VPAIQHFLVDITYTSHCNLTPSLVVLCLIDMEHILFPSPFATAKTEHNIQTTHVAKNICLAKCSQKSSSCIS